MWNTTGHATVIERFESAITNHNVSHAYIFYGSRQVGKMTCALDIARGLNCVDPSELACGKCVQCLRIHKKIHADVHIISIQNSENKRSIGISDVRDILHVSHMKPYEGSYRVTIIDDADLMTLEASNALLKTLEEPAEQNVFVLLTANEEALIPTIKSRCQSIYFSILDSESVSQHLSQNYDLSDEKLGLLTTLCAGRLGWAVDALSDDGLLEEREDAIRLFVDVLKGGLYRGFEVSEHLSNEYYKNSEYVLNTLHYWTDMYRDLLIMKKADISLIHNIDKEEQLSALIDECNEEELADNIGLVLDSTSQLLDNVVPRLCLDNLIMRINHKI